MELYRRSHPIVLVVDDDAAVRSAFHLVLDDTCEVWEAADAPAALDALTRETVDLVLLDVLMPGMGGLELLDRLREAVPDVPVVLVTALDEARTAVTAMKLGAFDYLTKPFDPEELLNVVRRALAVHRLDSPTIALVGGDAGTRACIAVLLRIWWPVEVLLGGADLGSDSPSTMPGVAIVDASAAGGADLVRPVRARRPLTGVIVVNADESAAFVGPGSLRCRAALRRPLKFVELFDEVAALSTPPSAHGSGPGLSPMVGRVVDHVIGHFPDASVEHIARVLATSPDHLSREFREATGIRLKSYLNRVRVEAAKYLLEETDEKLESLAERLGLHGAAHLSRLFVQHSGERPGSYRRSTTATRTAH